MKLRDAKPKRGEELGVGGDHGPSDFVFVECRGRKIKDAERASSCPIFFSFIFFFLFFFFFFSRLKLVY